MVDPHLNLKNVFDFELNLLKFSYGATLTHHEIGFVILTCLKATFFLVDDRAILIFA